MQVIISVTLVTLIILALIFHELSGLVLEKIYCRVNILRRLCTNQVPGSTTVLSPVAKGNNIKAPVLRET